MAAITEFDAMSIVIRAHVNPAIFSPMWAFHYGVVGKAEYEGASVNVISAELTQFDLEWLSLTATADRLQLTTSDVTEFERLRDAAVAIYKLLSDVPFIAMGITRSVHFQAESIEDWHAIGDILAPKDPWKDVLDLPGTQSLTLWGVRPDSHEGRIAVEVEPSARVAAGVFVSVNEHFELSEVATQPQTRADFLAQSQAARAAHEQRRDDKREGTDSGQHKRQVAIDILEKEWAACFHRSSAIISEVKSMPRRARS